VNRRFIILFFLCLIAIGCQKKDESNTPTGGNEPDFPINPAPSSFVYTQNNLVLNKGVTINQILPSYFGSPNNFTITPALPAGLTLNPSSGIISGTPTGEMIEEETYTITASNSFGSDTAEINLKILWSVPKLVKSNVLFGGGPLIGNLTGSVNGKLLMGNNSQGGQLLVSEGTNLSTVLVKQFDGASNISPQNFIALNNTTTLFTAENLNQGIELWKTDGTVGGTLLVKDINLGLNSSNPQKFVKSGSLVYFIANDGNGSQLFKTNGSSSGTIKLTNFTQPILELTSHNNELYFVANENGLGEELYKTDGSSVSLIADLADGTGSNPRVLTSVGNYLYFRADSGEGIGAELYRSNGLAIELVEDVEVGVFGSSIENIFNFNNQVLFSAYTIDYGRELWISNQDGTTLVSDLEVGPSGSSPLNFINYNNQVFFTASTSAKGLELYKTNGTTIELVEDLNLGSSGSSPNNFNIVNNYLYFLASNLEVGMELYRLDSNNVLNLITDLSPGSTSSNLVNFTNINNEKIYFFKLDVVNQRYDLYLLIP
jgi:ELWxxDGT repeat protein